MPIDTPIRPVKPDDISYLKAVIEANDLFPPQMLDEMISGYFNDDNSKDFWLTYAEEKAVAMPTASYAIAFCAPEKMTEGTWNVYLIAVHPDYQRQGIGMAMMGYIEQMLASRGERLLLVETSGLESFAGTRAFYQKCGYEQEAQIREFYQAGEDKIVFRKLLTDRK